MFQVLFEQDNLSVCVVEIAPPARLFATQQTHSRAYRSSAPVIALAVVATVSRCYCCCCQCCCCYDCAFSAPKRLPELLCEAHAQPHCYAHCCTRIDTDLHCVNSTRSLLLLLLILLLLLLVQQLVTAAAAATAASTARLCRCDWRTSIRDHKKRSKHRCDAPR